MILCFLKPYSIFFAALCIADHSTLLSLKQLTSALYRLILTDRSLLMPVFIFCSVFGVWANTNSRLVNLSYFEKSLLELGGFKVFPATWFVVYKKVNSVLISSSVLFPQASLSTAFIWVCFVLKKLFKQKLICWLPEAVTTVYLKAYSSQPQH